MAYKFTELQEKWLQALESGEYEQTQEDLCLDGKYCCLGVATHVFNPDHQALKDNGWYRNQSQVEATATAPNDVKEALKLNSNHGVLSDEHEYESLVDMNDSGYFTFKDIAKFIRENPEFVFKDGDKNV